MQEGSNCVQSPAVVSQSSGRESVTLLGWAVTDLGLEGLVASGPVMLSHGRPNLLRPSSF